MVFGEPMNFQPPISIVVPIYNYGKYIEKNIESFLNQDYPEFEVIAVNDGSSDDTLFVLRKFGNKIRLINHEKNMGFSFANNDAIKAAKYPCIAFITQDCAAKKSWLKNLMEGVSPDAEVITGVSGYQYTSTVCKKTALIKAGMFDESYGRSGYRTDTDLLFKLKDIGCTFTAAKKLDYEHIHEDPGNFFRKAKYLISRVKNHMWDPLLYKKNPKRAKEMLDIRLGFLRNPALDFKTATGLWHEGGKLELSSPQGIRIIENKTPIHTVIIIIFGIVYVFAVKLARLYGSIKFGKLLI